MDTNSLLLTRNDNQKYQSEQPPLVTMYGVSVVLPAFNEEQNISTTVTNVITTLNCWQID
jgi:hypothetical protein